MEMYDQKQIYADGLKATRDISRLNGDKETVLHIAYNAAVAELGYTDKDLMDKNKSRQVAKLMFSDKYLGNAEFNPLLGDSYASMDSPEQQRELKTKLGMNLHSFVGGQGVIDRYGNLRRGVLGDAVDKQLRGDTMQQVEAFLWEKTYDPEKSMQENIEAYAAVVGQDPHLKDNEWDKSKLESLDDAASEVGNSWLGQNTREGLEYRLGAGPPN